LRQYQFLLCAGVSSRWECHIKRLVIFATYFQLSKQAIEQDLQRLARFKFHIARYETFQIVNVDESGYNKKTAIRNYGYAMKGKRARARVVFVRGVKYTIEFALCSTGTLTYRIYEGAMDGQDFIEGSPCRSRVFSMKSVSSISNASTIASLLFLTADT
jgi:hypothetical protein